MSAQAPQDWFEAEADPSQFEVFTASDAAEQRTVSILVESDVGLTTVEYAEAIAEGLLARSVEEIARWSAETAQVLEVVMFEGWLGEDAVVWMTDATEDGTVIDIFYVFVEDVSESYLDLTYYSIDTVRPFEPLRSSPMPISTP